MPKKSAPIAKEEVRGAQNQNNLGLGNIIAIIVLVVLVGLGGVYLAKYKSAKTPTPVVSGGQVISYDCEEGRTALEVLKGDNQIETQDSDLGVFVDAINGIKNGDGSYWIYYINGEIGQVGVDQYNCKTGDKIEWRFEKLY